MVADISKWCETNVVQMWLVSLRNPEKWWCLREVMWKSGCTMEIYWKGDEIKGSAVRIATFSTLCIKAFTLINSLPNYDSFNSISSHRFRVLEHWLQSCYFGLQSWLSVLWSVHQVSPLERQEQFYFSLHYTDALEEDHKHSSIIKDVLLN